MLAMCSLTTFFRLKLKTVNLLLLLAIGTETAPAGPLIAGSDKNITVSIARPIQTVRETFEMVTSQTRLVFTYDESEVDLNRQVKLNTGSVSLRDLLNSITAQTGLKFTVNKKLIIVTRGAVIAPRAVRDTLVNGVVRDSSGNPLAGATVNIKGSRKSVVTDTAGNFSLEVPDDAVLVISFSGYREVEMPVLGRQNLDIVLNQLSRSMSEVVVYGYQSQKRADVTGAISIIDVSGVSKQPVGFLDQGLQGKRRA